MFFTITTLLPTLKDDSQLKKEGQPHPLFLYLRERVKEPKGEGTRDLGSHKKADNKMIFKGQQLHQ